jgi:hypothetical protein
MRRGLNLSRNHSIVKVVKVEVTWHIVEENRPVCLEYSSQFTYMVLRSALELIFLMCDRDLLCHPT